MGWGDEKNLKLIELYRNHECLWNPRHKEYKNNMMRNNAYLDLINNVDSTLTIKLLKAKIKNLRTTYHGELKKIEQSKRSGSGAGDVYIPSISWFYEMDSFLKDISKYRDTIESHTSESSQDSQRTGNVQESLQDSHLSGYANDRYSQDSQRTGNVQESLQNSTDNDMPTTLNADNIPTKRKRKIPQEQSITHALVRLENISSVINKPTEYDEFHFFGLNVAAQLRTLPLYESLNIQTEIQTILAAARRRHLQELPTISAYSTNPNTLPISSTFPNLDMRTLTHRHPTINTKPLTNPKTVTKIVTPSSGTQVTSTFCNPGTQTLTCTHSTSNTKPFTKSKAVTKIITQSTATQMKQNSEEEQDSEDEEKSEEDLAKYTEYLKEDIKDY